MSISLLIHGVLQNAASIAGLMLITGWMVADWPEDKPSAPMRVGDTGVKLPKSPVSAGLFYVRIRYHLG